MSTPARLSRALLTSPSLWGALTARGAAAAGAHGSWREAPRDARPLSSSSAAEIPAVGDPGASRAVRSMLAYPWFPLSPEVLQAAHKALLHTSEVGVKEAVEKAKAAAEAVEVFGDKLEHLRMELDELSGGKFGGETVGQLPSHVREALVSALSRYTRYVASFAAEEEWLRKKVEEELGSQLLLIKQRCSGLESEWGTVGLLGTSGLSGSFIEKRASLP